MRHVRFHPDNPSFLSDEQRIWWHNWVGRARTATDKALAFWKIKNKPPKLVGNIWSELKPWLLVNFFFGKCAYCENKFSASSFGDADHYRPKGAVSVRNNGRPEKVKCCDGSNHPGYFWLAYDWKNLLPACQRCNSTGKGTLFPVEVQHVCIPERDSDWLNQEEIPLLIHPYYHQPTKHLEFLERGEVKARNGSRLGKESIKTYLLNRQELRDERDQRQQDAKVAFQAALFESAGGGRRVADSMERYTGPQAVYSEAVKAFIERKRVRLLAELQDPRLAERASAKTTRKALNTHDPVAARDEE